MKYIFVTGMGRSGTTFLSRLLSHIEGVYAGHEYIGDREYWLLSWYLEGQNYAKPYLERAKNDIEREINEKIFIDVNSYLHHSTQELQNVFDPLEVFHIVRHPKDVVRSLYTRRTDKNFHILPKDRPSIEQWMGGDKFSQICWNWAATTKQLEKNATKLIHFEKLVSDYTYFNENLLSPFGLALPRSSWDTLKSTRVKKTKSPAYRYLYAKIKGKPFVKTKLPEYNQWSRRQKDIFLELCGDAMQSIGYDIPA